MERHLGEVNDSITGISDVVSNIGYGGIDHYNYDTTVTTTGWGSTVFEITLPSAGLWLVGFAVTATPDIGGFVTIATTGNNSRNIDYFIRTGGTIFVKATAANYKLLYRSGSSGSIQWTRRSFWIVRIK